MSTKRNRSLYTHSSPPSAHASVAGGKDSASNVASEGVLRAAGYRLKKKLIDSLQGSVWLAKSKTTKESVIVKITSRALHEQSLVIHKGRKVKVLESIVTESAMLRYLTKQSANQERCYITQYRDFLASPTKYFLVQQHGGHSLFDFVSRAHHYIQHQNLAISEWQRVCKLIFTQMVNAVAFIHKQRVCHHDISLENILLSDIEVLIHRDDTFEFCCDTNSFQVKLCDFGVAEYFDSDRRHFESAKFCGKAHYRSPESTRQSKCFDARANDVWALAVCLFIMLTGASKLVDQAVDSDPMLRAVLHGRLDKVLVRWDRMEYVDEQALDLMSKMFRTEKKRIRIDQIRKHPWLQ